MKPLPGGARSSRAGARGSATGAPVDHPDIGRRTAGGLEVELALAVEARRPRGRCGRHRAGRRASGPASRWQRPSWARPAADARSGGGSCAGGGDRCAPAGCGEAARAEAEPGEGLEQDGRGAAEAGRGPAPAPLSARPIQTPMTWLAVEADRPGVAIAIGGAGLVGDAPRRPALSGGGAPSSVSATYQAAIAFDAGAARPCRLRRAPSGSAAAGSSPPRAEPDIERASGPAA